MKQFFENWNICIHKRAGPGLEPQLLDANPWLYFYATELPSTWVKAAHVGGGRNARSFHIPTQQMEQGKADRIMLSVIFSPSIPDCSFVTVLENKAPGRLQISNTLSNREDW